MLVIYLFDFLIATGILIVCMGSARLATEQ